jgi:secreted PhoX family phosphatase
VTGKTTTLIDGISTPDGLAIDRQGNLFIADNFGILELNTNNQLLIVGTDANGITWDDVAPLSGSGAASY